MTYDPPNWQWCQNATSAEREEYKIACDKKHDRKNFIVKGKFLTINDLIEDCKNHLLPKLGELKLKGIAGVPRSGYLPASMCALWLNIPLYSFNNSGEFHLLSGRSQFGGQRMKDYEQKKGKILILDDTVYGGISIKKIKEVFKNHKQVLYGSLYVHPATLHVVDVYGKELPPPHLLEWNFFNSAYIENAVLDFDGILSPNVPYKKCQNEVDYVDYITNVKPLYHRIPRTYTCKGIITARLEKYRDITEAWLKKYKIKYGFLKMYPTEKEKIRNSNHIVEAAKFKSKAFADSDAAYFIESEPAEAALMRSQVRRLVICPDEGRFG
jgi:adenine/guanine phosphoribosyltransferase-like PRPP-binding protein